MEERHADGLLVMEDATPFNARVYSASRITGRMRYPFLPEIVIKLAAVNDDDKLRTAFLTTHHIIADCANSQLLSMLIATYESPLFKLEDGNGGMVPVDADTVRLNVCSVISSWLELFYDFFDDDDLLKQVQDFAESLKAREGGPAAGSAQVQAALKAFEERAASFIEPLPKPSSSDVPEKHPIALLSGKLTSEVIAQQLCRVEHALVQQIRPREYLGLGCEPGTSSLDYLDRYLQHFKAMRALLIAELIGAPSPKAQANMIKKAIQLTQYCISYNNFNTAMEVLSALFSPEIIEPSKSKMWEMLSSRFFEVLEQLSVLMSPTDGHSNYKDALRAGGAASVPFLGVHVDDISFINDFNVTQSPEGINVNKMLLLTGELQQLRQSAEYTFDVDKDLQQYIIDAVHSTPIDANPQRPIEIEKMSDLEGSDEKQQRMHQLWKFSEGFYSDASLIANHFVSVKDFQLGERDWKVFTTGTVCEELEGDQVVIDEGLLTSDAPICMLRSGVVTLTRNCELIKSISGPALLNHTAVLQTGQTTPLYTTAGPVELFVIDKPFLMSLLESDPDLSLHFFTDLAFRFIDELTRHQVAGRRENSSRKRLSSRHVTKLATLSHTGSAQRMPQTVRPANPLRNLGRNMDPKMLRDKEFHQYFGGMLDEVILKEYRAVKLGRTLNVQGTLFVSQTRLCFYAKIFNHESKVAIPLARLWQIVRKKNKLVVEWTLNQKKRKVVFKLLDQEAEEAVTLVTSVSGSLSADDRSSVADVRAEKIEGIMEGHSSSLEAWRGTTTLGLTPADWNLILRGAKRISFRKNSVVVAEGCTAQRLFQVTKGHCRIEKARGDDEPLVLGTIGTGEIFGEVPFVLCQAAAASVIAESDEVEVYVIEGFYISRLMQLRIALLGRFLHYLCTVMERRLMSRSRLEDQEERKVVDIVTEPLHLNLIRHPVLPLPNHVPIHTIVGPAATDMDEVESCYGTAVPYCAGTAISTYPMRDVPDPDDPEMTVVRRDGSPTCDQYRVNVYQSRIIAAVADGCNWGDAPRNAAVAARDAFVSYLDAHQEEITDVQFAGALILRAMAMANAAIFRGLDAELQQIGTTTLLGGIVLKMGDEDADSDDEADADVHNWGFVYGSIGDCKAFHWSCRTGQFFDITANNRTESLSASDCGGRLGPHVQGCLPDLRNLELGFYPCDEGDYFLIVSDGVHDNLDPQHLGFEPLDLGLQGESWATVPDLEVAEAAKTRYRLELLKKIVMKEIDSKSPIDEEEREIMRKLTNKVNELSHSEVTEEEAAENDGADAAETAAIETDDVDAIEVAEEVVAGKREVGADSCRNGGMAVPCHSLVPPLEIVRQLTCYCREICSASADWMRNNPSKRLPKDYRLYPGKMDHTTCVCFVCGERSPGSS